MKYIITKTIKERWTYYLDKQNLWNGLRDNALLFSDSGYADRILNRMRDQDPYSTYKKVTH